MEKKFKERERENSSTTLDEESDRLVFKKEEAVHSEKEPGKGCCSRRSCQCEILAIVIYVSLITFIGLIIVSQIKE